MAIVRSDGDREILGITRRAARSSWTGRILSSLLVLLIVSLLLDPGDKVLQIKMPLFVAVMGFWSLRLFAFGRVGTLNEIIAVLVIGLLIPGLWALLSFITTSSLKMEELFAYPKAFLFLPLLLLIRSEHFPLARITAKLTAMIAVLTIIAVLVSRVNPATFAAVMVYALAHGLGTISENRDQFGIGIGQFYYATSPLMMFGLAFFLHRILLQKRRWVDWWMVALFCVSLAFSGSRGNVLGAIVIVLTLMLVRVRKRFGMISAVLVTGAVLIPALVLVSARFFKPSEESNQVKLGHYQSYMEEFSEHPRYLLIGQGEGTRFYSKGFDDFTFVTELSYLELVRQFGIPVTVLLLSFLFAPLVILIRRQPIEGQVGFITIGYAAYLLVSATNPLLVSSTGMLVVVMAWATALEMGKFPAATPVPQLESPIDPLGAA